MVLLQVMISIFTIVVLLTPQFLDLYKEEALEDGGRVQDADGRPAERRRRPGGDSDSHSGDDLRIKIAYRSSP